MIAGLGVREPRGGNYYLPASMGGGVIGIEKISIKPLRWNPKLSDAYLWKGITLRKANRNAEARKALEQALQMNPGRLWAKQQLEKIPAQ